MNTADFEKVAGQLARCAVTRDAAEVGHIKQANGYTDQALQYLSSPGGKYLLGGLGGAGVGALIGATQPKRKGRNALYYGTMGGLGGLGLAHLINSAGGKNLSTTPSPTASTTPGTASDTNAPADNQASQPTTAGVLLEELTTPRSAVPNTQHTGEMFSDAARRIDNVVQQLPGMQGVSPAVQVGGGAAGLYAGVRGSRPLTGMFARRAERQNRAAQVAAQQAISANKDWFKSHYTAERVRARIAGEQAAANLKAQLGPFATPADLAKARNAPVDTYRAARAADKARIKLENSKRLAAVDAKNLTRGRMASGASALARIASMLGSTYAGATAPNWAPQLYNSANEAYNEATGYQGK